MPLSFFTQPEKRTFVDPPADQTASPPRPPNPVVTAPPPAPYVNGGFHSSDVLLFDPNGLPVPLSGEPNGDSLLRPNTNYQIRAVIHNSSPTAAVNTVVRFWQTVGGVGWLGTLIDVQSATVPGNGSVEVTAAHPFVSPSPGEHQCAVVSLSNSQSNFTLDATTLVQAWDEMASPGDPSPSAWRNTDSMSVFIAKPWQFHLATSAALIPGPIPDPGPIRIDIQTLTVPAQWANIPQVAAARQLLIEGGARNEAPLYLHSALQGTLQAIDPGIQVTPTDPQIQVEAVTQDNPAHLVSFALHSPAGKPATFTVSGQVPANAHPGDIYLVQVTAVYPQSGNTPAREVQFTESLFVQK